jgi:serine/threonine protein kinase
VEEALEITRQIAGGLASAHEQGIVHRDVKPANVVITEDATAKLLDFGVAKVLDSTRLTKSGSALGTLVYMSPEQLRGEDIGRQADLWSLAAVLYEMLSGRPPFAAKNEGALIHSILNRVPEDLTDSRSDVSPALELVLRKALAKEVEARYPTMDAFIVALDQARDDDAPTAIRETAAKDELGDRPVVAVLDFVNITRDPAADWLSTGIAESITTDLKKISSLKVIDRAKLQRVMGLDSAQELSEAELREEGMKVGTRWLFWGGYQKSGPSVRITAELLDVKEGRIVDSMKLDGSMDGIFALQDRLIARLTDLIDVELSDTEKRRIETPETYDLKAYEAYAKGRRLVNQMQRHTIAEAQQHFEKALEIDPEYALA